MRKPLHLRRQLPFKIRYGLAPEPGIQVNSSARTAEAIALLGRGYFQTFQETFSSSTFSFSPAISFTVAIATQRPGSPRLLSQLKPFPITKHWRAPRLHKMLVLWQILLED